MLGNLGFGELMVIMIIVLVLFGAKRVPEISASFGKGIREFKRNLNDVEESVGDAIHRGRYERRVPPSPRFTDTANDESPAEPKRLL